MPWVAVLILCVCGFLTFRSVTSHAAGVSATIKSGVAGYCLDDHDDLTTSNAEVDGWGCNGSDAQDWIISFDTLRHGSDQCLSVKDDGTSVGDSVILSSCQQAPGQIWLRDQSGFENPNSSLCLSMPNAQTNKQLVIASCSYLSQPYEMWTSIVTPSCNGLEQGDKVACTAVKEWTAWQSGTPSHETLLNSYTDGAPYEEWCADFVSYIYKEAGYSFTGGETNGWDENIASNIQYQGFTMHQAPGYSPQPGDVGYFDYAGGHVEIVISGGPRPTFIYGNSATIDPTTGNGQMEANTITSKGSEGQVVYYLSPH
jgi:hypothetical protein